MRGQFSWVVTSRNGAIASRGRKDPEIQKLQKLKPTKKLAEVPRSHPLCLEQEAIARERDFFSGVAGRLNGSSGVIAHSGVGLSGVQLCLADSCSSQKPK